MASRRHRAWATPDEVLARLRTIGAEALALRIAYQRRVSLGAMLGDDTTKMPARARHQLMAVMRWTLGLSFPKIGWLLGGYNHTTVMEGVKSYEKYLNDLHDDAVGGIIGRGESE